MIVLIDNYDSFTYNLVHYLSELGAEVTVKRNDKITVEQILEMSPDGILLSPGPCDPDKAGICLDLVGAASTANIPLLGVCLGHQTIGQYFGGNVVRCHEIVHGKMGVIQHKQSLLFKDLPSPIKATRYHSLIVERSLFQKIWKSLLKLRMELSWDCPIRFSLFTEYNFILNQ